MRCGVVARCTGIALGVLAVHNARAEPAGWPAPHYRFENNAPTLARVELGRRLFYDPRLSADGRVACASCHQQSAAFAHARHRFSHGIGDRIGTRNAPALFNVAWQPDFMWDGAVNHLEHQPLAPLTNPVEMGATLPDTLARLRADPDYPSRFEAAFGSSEIDSQRLLRALAQFLATLVSADSAYDRAQRGEVALSPTAEKGRTLFGTHCATCHAEPLFTDFSYRDNGLDAVPKDPGRGAITGREEDRGRFRVPSLRNVALTAPYMHDGRFETLDAVLDHYTRGLQSSSGLDPVLATPPTLDPADRRALIVFLQSLTDTGFVVDPRFAEPDAVTGVSVAADRSAPWTGLLGRMFGWFTSPAQARPAPAVGNGEASVTTFPSPSRIVRRIAPFEIVAVRDRGALRIWVDDDRSNAPRAGLDLQLRIGPRLLRAVEEAPGHYRMPFDAAIGPVAGVLQLRDADGLERRLDLAVPGAAALARAPD